MTTVNNLINDIMKNLNKQETEDQIYMALVDIREDVTGDVNLNNYDTLAALLVNKLNERGYTLTTE